MFRLREANSRKKRQKKCSSISRVVVRYGLWDTMSLSTLLSLGREYERGFDSYRLLTLFLEALMTRISSSMIEGAHTSAGRSRRRAAHTRPDPELGPLLPSCRNELFSLVSTRTSHLRRLHHRPRGYNITPADRTRPHAHTAAHSHTAAPSIIDAHMRSTSATLSRLSRMCRCSRKRCAPSPDALPGRGSTASQST